MGWFQPSFSNGGRVIDRRATQGKGGIRVWVSPCYAAARTAVKRARSCVLVCCLRARTCAWHIIFVQYPCANVEGGLCRSQIRPGGNDRGVPPGLMSAVFTRGSGEFMTQIMDVFYGLLDLAQPVRSKVQQTLPVSPKHMFATLSSFLPPVLHPGSQDKDKPPLKPTTEDVSAPQPVMAADDQGALRKKKERTHEVGMCLSCLLRVTVTPGRRSRSSLSDPHHPSLTILSTCKYNWSPLPADLPPAPDSP